MYAVNQRTVYEHQRPLARSGERREAPRKEARVPGLLSIPGLIELVPCRVLDLSATGARVVLTSVQWNPWRAPFEVKLTLPFERVEVTCTAVWIVDREIGLRFRGGMRHQ